jgi:succinylglutamic semialdehyde dehydrogenase
MSKARGDYINGRFVKPRTTATGELSSVDVGDLDREAWTFAWWTSAIDEAIASAKKAQASWGSRSVDQRVATLRKLREPLRTRSEVLAQTMSRETGRPRWECRQEALTVVKELDAVLRAAPRELSSSRLLPPGCSARYKPRGVVASITAATQPALLAFSDIVAALAAGCAVVCKTSPKTPASAQAIAEIVDLAELPKGLFNLVFGDHESARALATDERVDAVLFSGSVEAARALALNEEQLARPLRALVTATPIAAVFDDAHLEQAAYEVVHGAFVSAGQRCTNTRVVAVHEQVAAQLRDRTLELLSRLRINHGSHPEAFMGPLIDDATKNAFFGQLAALRDAADERAFGKELEEKPGRGHYVTPALFETAIENAPKLRQQLAIGPLLLFCSWKDPDELASLYKTPGPQICHCCFSSSEKNWQLLAALTHGGIVLCNRPSTQWLGALSYRVHDAFFGNPLAGLGTMRALSRLETTYQQEPAFDRTMLPPGLPYGDEL